MAGPRIIAGSARGLRLRSVPGDTTRPITDRTKESLFNIIGGDIQDASLLDLFAGTGSVGIEALSRGAAFVRFIDRERLAVETVKANLASTRLSTNAEVVQMDAFRLLEAVPDRVFDYVYIAPPQYKGMWRQTLELLDMNIGWLADNSWVIVQIHPVEYETTPLANLEEFDRRKYGSTSLVFYQIAGES